MNFGEALEQVKKGKAMRLPQWKEDVKIRCANIPTNVDKKEVTHVTQRCKTKQQRLHCITTDGIKPPV